MLLFTLDLQDFLRFLKNIDAFLEVSGFVGGDWLVKDGGLHFGEFALNNDVLINLGVGTNIVLVL